MGDIILNQELGQKNAIEPAVLQENCAAGVTKVTLNRPAQYNALSEELLSALENVLNDIRSDSSIRVVVLSGNGKAFCAGHDLKEMRDRPEKFYYQDLFRRCSQVMMAMVQLPQPVISRVHGMATAAGCQLVANSDLAVASTAAQFAVSGINLGLFCSTPSVPLSRNVSRKRAFEMLMTGRFISAQTAVDFGLINRVVGPEDLDAAVNTLAQDIASKPRDSIIAGKALFYKQLERDLPQAYAVAGEVMAGNMMFDDTQEGIDAFIEKRHPNWPQN
jgi:enoyl-CoA hydratase/carnithine racemase